ncbi:trypsin-like peptidase domain-containing protein [Candidatus Nomurabacteria bacterium]|nr:trypsin-like peptidase domain-containing protein [Candidatus Nomurabacteria bacterium]
MDQAPPTVTQTINRVVEKTIERVTQSATSTPGEKVTVVVKDEDLTISAVEKNSKSLVRIKGKTPGVDGEGFFGIGIVISNDGLIVADKSVVVQNTSYIGIMPDGTRFDLYIAGNTENSSVVIFKTMNAVAYKNFVPASFSDSETLKLGQTVISISGQDRNTVAIGNIASTYSGEIINSDGKSTTKIVSIETGFNKENMINGSPIITLSGDIAGLRLGSDASTRNIFTSSNFVKSQIDSLLKVLK